jgi:hypothetical protein
MNPPDILRICVEISLNGKPVRTLVTGNPGDLHELVHYAHDLHRRLFPEKYIPRTKIGRDLDKIFGVEHEDPTQH